MPRGDLVRRAIENVNLSAQIAEITIHNDVEDVTLNCDPFRIEQVFINILSNAIKYSPASTEVWVTSVTTGNSWEVSFQDQGFGFTPEDIQKVFRPFWRGHLKPGGNVISSTGIGLYLAKVIVERHGGTIALLSLGGNQGTTVKIILPFQITEHSPSCTGFLPNIWRVCNSPCGLKLHGTFLPFTHEICIGKTIKRGTQSIESVNITEKGKNINFSRLQEKD